MEDEKNTLIEDKERKNMELTERVMHECYHNCGIW